MGVHTKIVEKPVVLLVEETQKIHMHSSQYLLSTSTGNNNHLFTCYLVDAISA